MAKPQLMDLYAWQLAELIQSGKVTPTEAVEACLERIAERDGELNAFCALNAEAARAQAADQTRRLKAGEKLGLLAGIPFGVKDLEAIKGMVTTQGAKPLKDKGKIDEEDSIQVGRLRAAGGIPIGKTNTPLMGWTAVTTNLAYGSTGNPWATNLTCGGSSGGSAAAVAARMVPMATSSDGGGSIRIPAAYCGAFGLKPSRGRIPKCEGNRWGFDTWINQSHWGPTTRCVRDAAMYMDVASGVHGMDTHSLPNYNGSFHDNLSLDLRKMSSSGKGMRVAVSWDVGLYTDDMQPDIIANVREAVERMKAMDGVADVTVLSPEDFSLQDFGTDWAYNVMAQGYAMIGDELRDHRNDVDLGFSFLWERHDTEYGLKDLKSLFSRIYQCNKSLNNVFMKYDLLITPAVPQDPYLRDGGPGPVPALTDPAGKLRGKNPYLFMMAFNHTGHPASVVRAGVSAKGMPCAFQVVGRRHADDLVMQFSYHYEQKYKPFDSWPEAPFNKEPAPASKL